jgi:hypothetical protein
MFYYSEETFAQNLIGLNVFVDNLKIKHLRPNLSCTALLMQQNVPM